MYYRGTLTEFNTWHEAAMIAENIPTPDGKVGFVRGRPAPDNQRTTAYTNAIAHPTNEDDYIWAYADYPDESKASLSEEEVQAAGWFPESEVL